MNPFSILNMFGRSPFKPLGSHMCKVTECVEELLPFFEAIISNQWDLSEKIQQKIALLEHEADRLKRELRLSLPSNLFLPVARGDLLQMVIMQDRIANKAKDIAGLIIGRKMMVPPSLHGSLLGYLQTGIDATRQAKNAILELEQLLETGFSGSEMKLVRDMIIELDEIEHLSDALQVSIRHALYDLEKELLPIDVIFLYKIIDWIGDLADRSQNVGGQLQVMTAR